LEKKISFRNRYKKNYKKFEFFKKLEKDFQYIERSFPYIGKRNLYFLLIKFLFPFLDFFCLFFNSVRFP